MKASVTLTMPGAFKQQNWELTVREELHAGSDELGQLLLFKVSARTPVDTAALLSDEYYKAYPNRDSDNLAFIGVGDENQMDEWGRFYALYQEGGALGLATYTNAPHEMFARILTDDIPDVEAWGNKWLISAMGRIATGTGAIP